MIMHYVAYISHVVYLHTSTFPILVRFSVILDTGIDVFKVGLSSYMFRNRLYLHPPFTQKRCSLSIDWLSINVIINLQKVIDSKWKYDNI